VVKRLDFAGRGTDPRRRDAARPKRAAFPAM